MSAFFIPLCSPISATIPAFKILYNLSTTLIVTPQKVYLYPKSIPRASWRTISNLERGAVVPSLELICNLSKHLNISIDELLNNKIQTNKSLTRLKKESEVIEEVRTINDKLLEHLSEYIKLLKKIA